MDMWPGSGILKKIRHSLISLTRNIYLFTSFQLPVVVFKRRKGSELIARLNNGVYKIIRLYEVTVC